MEKFFLFFLRLIFFGLSFFEGLNFLGILKFTLEFSWLGLFLTALSVWLGLEWLNYFSKKRFQYNFPVFIFLIPAFNVLFDALGDIFYWYAKFLWYDQLMHFWSGTATAAVIFFIVHGISLKRKFFLSQNFIGFFSFFAANSLGILYELEEYAESFFLRNNRLGDRFDTPNDLFLNMMGALAGLFVAKLIIRLRRKNSAGR